MIRRTTKLEMGVVLGIVVVATVAAGCRPAATVRPGMTDFRVTSIELVGVSSVDRQELLEALATQRNRFNPFGPVSMYNRFEFAEDVQRIETFYAAHGYFDARVVDHEVELDDSGKRNRARVRFVIDEGYQTSFGADAVYDTGDLRAIVDPSTLIGNTPVRAGRPFDLETVELERERLRRALQERSYARAQVEARVYVSRETFTARVYYFFTPGVACVFGEIEVVGNRNIPADLVRRSIDIRAGRVYRHSLLRKAQVDLYDLDAFTSVDVEAYVGGMPPRPESSFEGVDEALASDGFVVATHLVDRRSVHPSVASLLDNLDQIASSDPVVPIVITLSESPSASYRTGGGLAIESSRTEAYGRAAATWRNVLAPLNRAELEGRLGYAWLPSVFGRESLATGIVGEVQAGLSRPRVIFGIFDAGVRVGFQQGVETDHSFSRPKIRFSIDNRLNEFTRMSFGYAFEINLTRDFATEIEQRPSVGRDSCDALPRAFRIGYFDAALQSERRDPLLKSNDWAGSVRAQLGEGLAGDYPYLRVEPEIRYYQRLTRRWSIASRAGFGAIFDFGEPVPRSQCLYLGGGSTVRGFAERRLGPHQEADIPSGGVASYLVNFEPRLALSKVFGLVAFLDAGQVNDEIGFNPRLGGATGVGLAAGGGFRIFTPIGPIRADVGARLTPMPGAFGRIRPFAFVVSLGEAF